MFVLHMNGSLFSSCLTTADKMALLAFVLVLYHMRFPVWMCVVSELFEA